MLKINLIPEKVKEEISLKKTYATIKGLNFTLIFLAVLISAIFISSKSFLAESSNTNGGILSVSDEKDPEYKKPIEINRKLNLLKKIIDEHYSYPDLISNISNKVPNGISLSRLRIDTVKNKIEIRGRADVRDDLLFLKTKMEEDLLYENLHFPLQNLLNKENIDFSITAEINTKIIK